MGKSRFNPILDDTEMLKLAGMLLQALSAVSGERGMTKEHSAHLESRLHSDDASLLFIV